MPRFRKLTLDDIPSLKKYFDLSETRLCDCTVGGTFMWREYMDTRFAVTESALVFKTVYLTGVLSYTFPLVTPGGDIEDGFGAVVDDCRESGAESVSFCAVAAESLPVLKDRFPDYCCCEERQWFDYLYDADDMISLAGRRYSGQRNHINKFRAMYPDAVFEAFDPSCAEEAAEFFERVYRTRGKAGPIADEEHIRGIELLRNFSIYGQLGGVLRVGGKLAGVSVGEIVNDTLFIHLEKADTDLDGVYPMLSNTFARTYRTPQVRYINREEDDGDLGLRTSKLSYHPVKLLEKYTFTAKL